MVEDHIQEHLYSGLVQPLYHFLKLSYLVAVFVFSCVGRLGGAEGNGAVPPVIYKFLPGYRIDPGVFIFIKFTYRHQFDGGNSQLLQVWNFFDNTGKGPWMPDL